MQSRRSYSGLVRRVALTTGCCWPRWQRASAAFSSAWRHATVSHRVSSILPLPRCRHGQRPHTLAATSSFNAAHTRVLCGLWARALCGRGRTRPAIPADDLTQSATAGFAAAAEDAIVCYVYSHILVRVSARGRCACWCIAYSDCDNVAARWRPLSRLDTRQALQWDRDAFWWPVVMRHWAP